MKWDMGWMHDTLTYFARTRSTARYHHDKLTFRMLYAYSENFVLPLSHDEVVHGKGSLIDKMPGDDWQKFANLRLLYGYMWAQPGKKLLFQGGEFGQWREWAHDRSVDWHLRAFAAARAADDARVTDLNRLYRSEPALHVHDVGRRRLRVGRRQRRRQQRVRVPAPGGRRRRRRRWRCSTSPRCRATTTASACR